LLLLLHLLQIAQQLLRRFWLPIGRLPIRRLDWRLLARRIRGIGGIRHRLPADGVSRNRRGNFAVGGLVGGVVFLVIRHRGRRRSWLRCNGSNRGVLTHGQHDPRNGIRLLRRTKQNVVETRAVQQRRQNVTWLPRPKTNINSLAGDAGRLYERARGVVYRPQHVAQSGVFGSDTEQSIAKSDLRRFGRCLGGRSAGIPGWNRLPSRRRGQRRSWRRWRSGQQGRRHARKQNRGVYEFSSDSHS